MSGRGDFWSRRKAQVEAEAQAEVAAAERADDITQKAELAEKSDAEILEELGLKDPDEMNPEDDFAAFMKGAVPEHLRKRALRKLWRSNPVLANIDGLNDYDEDYTKIGKLNGPIQTAYQVGKGMLAHVNEMARKAEAEAAAMADPQLVQVLDGEALPVDQQPVSAPDEPAGMGAPAGEKVNAAASELPKDQAVAADTTAAQGDEATPTRRRMQFSFLD